MKIIRYILGLGVLLSASLFAQDTLILQPDAFCGQDTYIWELSNQDGEYGPTESKTYGDNKSFIAHEWTWNGDPGRRKSLINFNLSNIPPGSIILEAYLDLYAYPDSPDNGHISLTGSNQAVLKRITSPWTENTVTWNTQPTTTDENQVFLSESISDDQDYLGIDMTEMCQDMVDNPSESTGIMFSIVQPSYYRAMIFASSDHPNPDKHPRLTVIYIPSSSPLPNGTIHLTDTTICDNQSILYNAYMPCSTYKWSTGSNSSEITVDSAGFYWVEVINSSGVFVDTFEVKTIDCSYALVMPNVISPNLDGLNDFFIPILTKGIVQMNTKILNRWGQVVFETNDPSILWNGKSTQATELPDGVYFWTVEFTTLDGSIVNVHGNVHLLR